MAATVTTMTYMLKERYSGQRIMNVIQEMSPSLGMAAKDTGFVGKYMPIPITYGGGQGIAGTVSEAQTAESNTVGEDFQITTGRTFAVNRIENEAILAARNDVGAFMKGKLHEIDNQLVAIKNALGSQFFGNGGGSIGRINTAYTSGNTITLAEPKDIVNFEKNMLLVASTADGSGSSDSRLDSGDTMKVTSVNREAGSIVVDDATQIAGLAASNYLFRAGVFAGNVSQTRIWKGLGAWCPSSAPSSGTFFGAAWTLDTRLSGYRESTTTGSLESRIDLLCTNANNLYDAAYDLVYTNPLAWRKLRAELAGQGIRPLDVKDTTGKFGYKAMEYLHSGGQTAAIIGDRYCPVGTIFGMEKKDCVIMSMMDMVHLDTTDGNESLRVSNDAAIEVRFESFAQVVMKKTTSLGRVASGL